MVLLYVFYIVAIFITFADGFRFIREESKLRFWALPLNEAQYVS